MIVIFLKNDDSRCSNLNHSLAAWFKISKCQHDGGLASENTDYAGHAQCMHWSINNNPWWCFSVCSIFHIHLIICCLLQLHNRGSKNIFIILIFQMKVSGFRKISGLIQGNVIYMLCRLLGKNYKASFLTVSSVLIPT